jgi:hypothetical protein
LSAITSRPKLRLFSDIGAKKDGAWSLRGLTLKVDGQDSVIDLICQSKVEIKDFRWRVGQALLAFS